MPNLDMRSLYKVLCAGLAVTGTVVASDSSFSGPVFPPPRSVSEDADFSAAMKGMSSALQKLVDSSKTARDSSIAIMGGSASELKPAFEFYHTGAQADGAATQIGPDSVFRIGSISKLFTVYGLLVQFGYDVFSEPILKHVPELRRRNDTDLGYVDWEDVSVGALASHMAGVSRSLNMGDLAAQDLPLAELGLPHLAYNQVPHCNGNFDQPLCRQFLDGINDRDRTFPAWGSPAYSNAAFQILGYMGSKSGNRTFSRVLKEEVLEPLKLTDTSIDKPEDGRGVIPPGRSLWSYDMGDEFTSGGIYSSVRDLCAFGQAILSNKQLTATTTRHWMKPVAFTQSLNSAVGMPWEVERQFINGHIVDMYTKSGDIGQYQSLLVLVPEYDFVFAGLSAGSNPSLPISAVATVREYLMPALEKLSQKQAALRYCGRYVSDQGNNSISIATDDRPGLLIDGWINNGVDFVQSISAYIEMTGSGTIDTMRLYPTDVRRDGRTVFRLVVLTGDDSETGSDDASQHGVKAWMVVDVLTYGKQPMDELIFTLDKNQEVIGVESVGLRSMLEKVV